MIETRLSEVWLTEACVVEACVVGTCSIRTLSTALRLIVSVSLTNLPRPRHVGLLSTREEAEGPREMDH